MVFKAFVVCFFLRCLKERTEYLNGATEKEELKIGFYFLKTDFAYIKANIIFFSGHLLSHFMEISTMNSHEVGVLCTDGEGGGGPVPQQNTVGMQRQVSKISGVSRNCPIFCIFLLYEYREASNTQRKKKISSWI